MDGIGGGAQEITRTEEQKILLSMCKKVIFSLLPHIQDAGEALADVICRFFGAKTVKTAQLSSFNDSSSSDKLFLAAAKVIFPKAMEVKVNDTISSMSSFEVLVLATSERAGKIAQESNSRDEGETSSSLDEMPFVTKLKEWIRYKAGVKAMSVAQVFGGQSLADVMGRSNETEFFGAAKIKNKKSQYFCSSK